MQAAMPIRVLKTQEKRQFLLPYFFEAVFFLVVMGIPALVVGAFISPFLGMVTWIGGTIYVVYRRFQKTITSINGVFAGIARILPTALQRVDFCHVEMPAGIAMDVENKQIAFVSVDAKCNISKPLVFSVDKIRGYQAHSPGHSEVRVYGGGITDTTKLSAELDNYRARNAAALKTGLFIDLDDIEHPQIAAIMPYADAEAWLLLIEKCINGTLEKRVTPTIYPFIKS